MLHPLLSTRRSAKFQRIVPRSTIRFIAVSMLSAAGLLPQPSGATDNYPSGAMASFNLSVCPSGWTLTTSKGGDALNGYFLVPFAPPVPETVLVEIKRGWWENHRQTARRRHLVR